jgi:nucleoside-triphosphatase THEP1
MTLPRGGIVFLTGERGSGKTTACRGLRSRARDAGLDCAGIVCPAVFEAGIKVGIDVADVRTGERRALATVDGSPAGLRLGPFRFDEDSLAWGASRLDAACPCDLLIVDEIGPLEIERGQGWAGALDILARGEFGLAVVVVRRSLVSALQERLAGRVTAMVSCSPSVPNSDAIAQLLDLVAGLAPASGPGPASG